MHTTTCLTCSRYEYEWSILPWVNLLLIYYSLEFRALIIGLALSRKDSKSCLLFSVYLHRVWLHHWPQKNSPPSPAICECRGSSISMHSSLQSGLFQEWPPRCIPWPPSVSVFVAISLRLYGRCWPSQEVMLFYDIMLTFADEVERIWKRKISMMSVLFLLVRFSSSFEDTVGSEIHPQPQESVYLAIRVHCNYRLWVD